MSEFLSVVHTLAGFAVNPLWGQVEYMLLFNRKIETLRHKLDILKNMETGVQQLVVEATRNAEVIKPYVKDWLQNVDNLKEQARKILENAENSEMQCLFHTCPNLKTRYSLGKEATEKTAEADKLLEEGGTFQRVGEIKELVQTLYLKPGDFGAFETRISTKKKIIKALKDQDDVSIIGICGMAGVGKTTMAKEIVKEVKVDNLFDEVAIAVISQNPDVIKIQGELADMLGLKIEEMYNKFVRAERLRKRLGGDRCKSTLIILDDVWEEMDLGTIGIPSAGDDKKLNILLTSRFEDVCRNMGAQRIHKVNVLSREESWELFKDNAHISDDATDVIKSTAEKVARECDGLPLALVTVGRALRKREEHAWKNALEELRNSRVTNIKGMHKLVYSRIELSYNYLESPEAKSLLLLFSLFPEDYNVSIEDLSKYAWGLDLFSDTMTLSTARHKVNSIVDTLKSCCLLLPSDIEECAKLHDVVRDVCLQIASKEKDAYMSRHTGLKEWPEHDNNESYSAISLTLTDQLNQLPGGLEYPNLKFLLVMCQRQSLDVSRDFFINMRELKVLDFTSMRIQIPSSIQLLTNLRTLGLYDCTLNIEIPTIGNLKKLEVLSFYGSDLDHFPNDIAKLSNLRSLDLRLKHSSSYSPLPPGILLQLKKLEELYMGVVEIRDGELEQRGYCIIKEISSLTCLNTFQISTHDRHFLLQILHVLCIEKLERFHIELTDLEHARKRIGWYYYFRRRLHLNGFTYASMLSQPAVNSLMRRTDHLSIFIDNEGMNNLDDLSLQDGFEYLNGNHLTGAFDRLQEIYLQGIPTMKHLWRGVIKPPSLHNLIILSIVSCPSVKSLFLVSGALCMVNLQSLCIYTCEMLEEIVSLDTDQIELTQMPEFPKLRVISLRVLRNFKSFRSGSNKIDGVLNPLFKQVTLPNLEQLDICALDDVSILFDFEYTKDDTEISILSQLTSLRVVSLPKLVHITRMFPPGIHIFENLTNLDVSHCNNLSYLFSPAMANTLIALKFLNLSNCKALEEIIGTQEEDNTSKFKILEEGTTSRIVFPKLRDLSLYYLDRLRLLSSQNYELLFPSLESLQIINCPVMTKFCSRQSAPMLYEVRINFSQTVDISDFMDSTGSISQREDDNFSDTSNINEDTDMSN